MRDILQGELFDGSQYDESDQPWRLPFDAIESTGHASRNSHLAERIRDNPGRWIHAGTRPTTDVFNREYLTELVPAYGARFPKTRVMSDMAANDVAESFDPHDGNHMGGGVGRGRNEDRVNDRIEWAQDPRRGVVVPYVNESEGEGEISMVGPNRAFTTREEMLRKNRSRLPENTYRELRWLEGQSARMPSDEYTPAQVGPGTRKTTPVYKKVQEKIPGLSQQMWQATDETGSWEGRTNTVLNAREFHGIDLPKNMMRDQYGRLRLGDQGDFVD